MSDSDRGELASESASENGPAADDERQITALTERISPLRFDNWYREREFRNNIREGQHYFNGPANEKPPERHSPSRLLQCQRKTAYKQLNAPEESEDPTGIFWVGSRFEEDIIVPFLQEEVTQNDEYVTNSLWVDFEVTTEAGQLRIKGETDPVIVTSDAEPLLVTEIKTKRSVENTDSPSLHHKAQAHAYLRGLSEKYDRTVSTAIILYGSRTTFNIKAFQIDFDPYFWRQAVIGWAADHTEYRLNDELPPGTPEYDWECDFCSFKERCGQGTLKFEDIGTKGLLPGFTEYPKPKLVEYLEAHNDAKLTPSLAHEHPELVGKYGVFDWKCRGCSETVAWDAVEWNGDTGNPPTCPICSNQGPVTRLVGPAPADQLEEESDDR